MSPSIPLGRPTLLPEDMEAMVQASRGVRLTLGPMTELFEQRIAASCRRPWAVAVASSATAIEIGLRALGVGSGDEVLVPAFSYAANAHAVLAVGGRPVFVDVDPRSLCMCAQDAERKVTACTKALIGYAPFGSLTGLLELSQLCNLLEIPMLENATESLGASNGSDQAGQIGRLSVVGFGPYRCVTVGEGGALVTHDDRLAHACRILRFQGRTDRQSFPDQSPDLGMRMEVAHFGYDARLSEPLAALGASQMTRLPAMVEARHAAAEHYFRRLAGHPDLWLPKCSDECHPVWYLFPTRLSDRFGAQDRDAIIDGLHRHDIGAGNHYPALSALPHLRQTAPGTGSASCPAAESVSARMLTLPMANDLRTSEIDDVCSTLELLLAQHESRGAK
ncbi:MAG: DegT/DnrJ/EryC1/StrS aminotransferase family protein [Planctomycetota bacterium]|nr:DegT/DnrJ/EryC1/StrS aminotransferase family protein [Planctomycetota bacterium]MDA1105516.1 DegT/DnrJ/EryC1/StrS aminotransferase family protein [Planctomycetota bacterium]